ncbi:MAG: PKD domain-containing protein [Acidimicrobiia bacterium]
MRSQTAPERPSRCCGGCSSAPGEDRLGRRPGLPSWIGHPGCVVPRISTSTNPIYAGQPVTFTDYYTGTHKRRWTMGDGSVLYNNSQTLIHTYATPGTYTVSLVTRSGGARTTITRTFSVLAP